MRKKKQLPKSFQKDVARLLMKRNQVSQEIKKLEIKLKTLGPEACGASGKRP